MLSPRLGATRSKSYPSCLEAKNSADQLALSLLLRLSHSESGYNTPIANATAAARGSPTPSGRRPKIPCTTHGITTQAPGSLLTALRDAAEPRASVKPGVNPSAIGLVSRAIQPTQRDDKCEIFSRPPEAVVTATQHRMDPVPHPRSRLVLVTAAADPEIS